MYFNYIHFQVNNLFKTFLAKVGFQKYPAPMWNSTLNKDVQVINDPDTKLK